MSLCEPQNRDNGASDVWALTAYFVRGLRFLARIFSPAIAQKSSGFARILLSFFARKLSFEKFGGGAAALAPRLVRFCVNVT